MSYDPYLLLRTDVYKFGHREQYPPGTNKVYSYLESRGSRIPGVNHTVFFGLQYYLKKFLTQSLRPEMAEEWIKRTRKILGENAPSPDHIEALCELGYFPLKIKALPEGSVVPCGTPLMSITNVEPEFFWLVNYIETLLLKVWYPCTVATNSLRFRMMFEQMARATCENSDHVKFQMHDFGYRGVSTEETAEVGGMSHLLSFFGTDTTPGAWGLDDWYGASEPIALSVPASEHSVMCSWDIENDDLPAIRNMLQKYPNGIVSIVSDSYDLWRAIIEYYGDELKELILARNGKTVIRPDSGDPVKIVCGDYDAEAGTPENKGMIRLLDEIFGSTINNRGYKEINPKVGCIYGDAIYYERAEEIMRNLAEQQYASSNIVFGSGGLLLQNWNRDTFKFAIKATYCEVNGEPRAVEKMPKTDTGKKSKKGYLSVMPDASGQLRTLQSCTPEEEVEGLLQTVYERGNILQYQSGDEIRKHLDDLASRWPGLGHLGTLAGIPMSNAVQPAMA